MCICQMITPKVCTLTPHLALSAFLGRVSLHSVRCYLRCGCQICLRTLRFNDRTGNMGLRGCLVRLLRTCSCMRQADCSTTARYLVVHSSYGQPGNLCYHWTNTATSVLCTPTPTRQGQRKLGLNCAIIHVRTRIFDRERSCAGKALVPKAPVQRPRFCTHPHPGKTTSYSKGPPL